MTTLTQIRPLARPSTLSALRYRNFRLFFAGQLISVSGTWMQRVAQGWLVFHLTRSELWLGLVACASGLPMLLMAPWAGVVVDRFPRRVILLTTQVVQMFLAFVLATLTFADLIQVWHVMVVASVAGMTLAFEAPSRHTFISDMVGRENLNSGIALNSIMMNSSSVIGPTLAGFLLVQVGPGWCFFINGLSFLAVIGVLLLMRIPTFVRRIADFAPLQQLKDGLRFSRRHLTIAPLLMLAATNSVLGLNMVLVLLPAFADTALNSPKTGYAALSAASGAGAIMGGILNVTLGNTFGRGRVVSVMAVVTPGIVLLFSQTTYLPAAILLNALIGFGFMSFYISTNTLIQSEVADEFRGRVLSLYTLTFLGLAPLGALVIGSAAQAIGTPEVMGLCALLNGVICASIVLGRGQEARRLP